MASPLTTKLACVVTEACVEGAELVVRFSAVRGHPAEIVDRIRFDPHGDADVVQGVGRFLRIVRAGRLRVPEDPYRLYNDLERAAELLRRCRGTRVGLVLHKRYDRGLSVWTEAGVERFTKLIDFHEEPDALVIRRSGGQSALRIPRQSVIRWEASTLEYHDVVAVES